MSQFGKNVLNDGPASLLLEDSPVELHRVANQEKLEEDREDYTVNYQPKKKMLPWQKKIWKRKEKKTFIELWGNRLLTLSFYKKMYASVDSPFSCNISECFKEHSVTLI